ncbi:MAG: hypothetical protein C0505_11950 [Leptothrix sp. (in: Bacteria)]|nr:hypothetical protein [Leptothrix sp. (in: b-proteobacteria)]
MCKVRCLAAAPLAVLTAAASAQPSSKVVGVFAPLGDGVEVSMATDGPRDTRIERTARQAVASKGMRFDLIAP